MRQYFFFLLFFALLIGTHACKPDPTDENLNSEEIYFEDYEEPYLKWGYIDIEGNIVIEKKYDDLRPFNDGLAIANYKGKWGFIDKNGATIIEHKYRSAFPFKNGLARIQNFDKKYGFIDKSGKMIIPDTFDLVFDFNSNLARAKKNENYGYIDTKGHWAIRSNYKKCSNFTENIAKVYQFGKAGLINSEAKYLIPLEDGNQKIFDTDKDLIRTKKNGAYQFYSKSNYKPNGKTYIKATDFYHSLAAVKEIEGWKLINDRFQIISSFEADDVKYAAKDRWIIKNEKQYEIINNKGKKITSKSYDMIFSYNNGFAPYQTGDYWGYLNMDGQEVMAPILPLAWEFEENYARIIYDGRITYIDTSMQVKIQKGFIDAHNFSEGLAHVQ